MRKSGYLNGWRISGSNPYTYELTKDYTEFQSGNSSGCFYPKGIVDKEQFGVMLQEFKANNYKGKRLELCCILKTEEVMKCSVWMQVNNTLGDVIHFDNMEDRSIYGTTDWGRHSIVLDVPSESESICFGILLIGDTGKVWVDSFHFKEVDEKTPTTNIGIRDKLPNQPLNLEFNK
ncbi:hypothetical protein [Lysinibacillus odysseyi]|uniref:hypothetical protein n=1 Tax=Lysinibacillus odysseyi TaxID=202611 RepID=UPI000691C762|nr:hypothetical protein [Lysinibacillus odysseyi]